MSNAFDVAAALSGLSAYSDAWQFIRDFAAEWSTPINEADGVSVEELDAAEQRLGVQLPAAVRQAYLLLARRSDLTSQSGTLYLPDELAYDHENRILVFRAEHQGVAFYGASLADPQQDDPPVLVCLSMMDKATESWAHSLTASRMPASRWCCREASRPVSTATDASWSTASLRPSSLT